MSLAASLQVLTNSWVESLRFFLPNNLQPFLLVTLKSIKETFSIILQQKRILVLGIISLIALTIFLQINTTGVTIFAELLLWCSIVIFLLAATRPSIDYKDSNYFFKEQNPIILLGFFILFFLYLPYELYHHIYSIKGKPYAAAFGIFLIWLFKTQFSNKLSKRQQDTLGVIIFLFLLGMLILFIGIAHLEVGIYFQLNSVVKDIFKNIYIGFSEIFLFDYNKLFAIMATASYLLSPLIIFWILFMLDAQATVSDYFKALGRAFVMFIYNYPFCLIIYSIIRVSIISAHALSNWLFQPSLILSIMGYLSFIVILLPVYSCLLTNFYIKRIHDQFSLYYKQ